MTGLDSGRSRVGALAACLALALAASLAARDAEAILLPGPPQAIVGEAQVGETLTSVPANASDAPADRFRWQRCDPAGGPCSISSGPLATPETDPGWADIPGAEGLGLNTYTLADEDLGLMVRVLARYDNPLGGILSKWASSGAEGPVAAPPPIVRETANIDPLSGATFVQEPDDVAFRLVSEPEQIQLGSVIDVQQGHANVTTERNFDSGILQTAESWDGTYRITQGAGNKPVTRLKLVGAVGGPFGEPARGRSGGRRLWGRGRCRCRTRGRYSSGTVRGTWWLTVDRADATITKVKKGAVEVRDFGRRKSVLVKAGERYIASPDR